MACDSREIHETNFFPPNSPAFMNMIPGVRAVRPGLSAGRGPDRLPGHGRRGGPLLGGAGPGPARQLQPRRPLHQLADPRRLGQAEQEGQGECVRLFSIGV